jgi:uncharacterized membrane protein
MVAIGRLLHFAGLAMALGGSVVIQKILAAARQAPAANRAGLEIASRQAITKVELVGLFVALAGGILLIVAYPAHLNPRESGAGPWLHIKLLLVLVVLILSHLKMFKIASLVRERETGSNEADLEKLHRSALTLGSVESLVFGLIFVVACFRYVFFA